MRDPLADNVCCYLGTIEMLRCSVGIPGIVVIFLPWLAL